MTNWLWCFSGNAHERKQKSKEEIKMTLTQREYQTDPKKNFFWRLMSSEDGYRDTLSNKPKSRVDLAMVFLQVMMENSYFEDFVVTTLGPKHTKAHLTDLNLPLNRIGSVESDWNETTTQSVIPELHKAARLEKVEEVKKLVKYRENLVVNPQGYTALHFAAMAINPNKEIAKLLIDSVNGNSRFLDKQTDGEWGGNTALHIAAANVNVTEEFIQQFQNAESVKCLNSKNDTPFHVAAKSRNPDAIIYMLNTFAPTNEGWDVDEVDKGQDSDNTVINICARKGNAKAVELLIKHGANISRGVLHEIVLESVRDREKIDKLKDVYNSIVDNAVTWWCLEKAEKREIELLKVKGSDEYAELFRKIMIWLLTSPPKNEKYEEKDVLECALAHGASTMFWQIINTKSVFRMHGEEALKCTGGDNNNKAEKRTGTEEGWNWTVFDVTNFTEETRLRMENDVKPASSEYTDYNDVLSKKLISKEGDENQQHALAQSIQPNRRTVKHPEKPYLTYLLTVFDQWKGSNILSTQPLKELTKPHIALVQCLYFISGMLQLFFMVLFTVHCMPTTCCLVRMFNISTTYNCGSTNEDDDNLMLSNTSRHGSWTMWLIWPAILLVGNLIIAFHQGKQARICHKQRSQKAIFTSKDLRSPSHLRKLRQVLQQAMSLRIFCVTVFVWIYVYFISESHESYVEVTAMVLLFGWITNLEFFGVVSKNISISQIVVNEIIVKNIPSFLVFFGFTVVGFSFAMHTIRMSVCMHNRDFHLDETFFAVLSSAFGIGDFFDATVTDSTCSGGATMYLFEFVYVGYVCATMIILLNVLIAMMNNRYEKAKRRAENIWRFRILSKMKSFESIKWLVKAIQKCRMAGSDGDSKSRCCCVPRWYSDKHLGKLFYNEKRKRYYLRLLLPVDKQLEKR